MPEPDRIPRIRSVLNRTGLSRSTLYREMKEGSFPPRVKLGELGELGGGSAIDARVVDPEGFDRSGIRRT